MANFSINGSVAVGSSSREAPTVPPPPPGLAAEALDARASELEAFAQKILARSSEMRMVARSIRGGQ